MRQFLIVQIRSVVFHNKVRNVMISVGSGDGVESLFELQRPKLCAAHKCVPIYYKKTSFSFETVNLIWEMKWDQEFVVAVTWNISLKR